MLLPSMPPPDTLEGEIIISLALGRARASFPAPLYRCPTTEDWTRPGGSDPQRGSQGRPFSRADMGRDPCDGHHEDDRRDDVEGPNVGQIGRASCRERV